MAQTLTTESTAAALAALGHAARLSVYRVLVRAGEDGLIIGQIQDHLNLPPSTLAHHLRVLVQSGLVIQEKRGREVINRPDFGRMQRITAFLSEECCAGLPARSDVA